VILPRGTQVVQHAWVVDSLGRAIEGWLALGVGPFFTRRLTWDDAVHRGRVVPLSIRVALAQVGATQIELVEQTSSGDSCYRDVVPAGSTGFHHVCMFTDDVEREAAALTAAGIVIAGELPRPGSTRTIYADTREQIGAMLEILEPSDQLRAWYDLVADGARGWDGRDPVREITPELLAAHAAT
jgi:hypothetical protein